jgi:hypothetical protein
LHLDARLDHIRLAAGAASRPAMITCRTGRALPAA